MIRLDGGSLDIPTLVRAARGEKVSLAEEGLARMRESRGVIDDSIARRVPVYGVTTGLGARSTEALGEAELAAFSEQTLRGRAQATGEIESVEATRAGLVVRLNTLLSGFSGASVAVAEHLAACLNAGLTPVTGRIGSVGPADLVVNATVGLALIGQGRMVGPSGIGDATEVLRGAGLSPLTLGPRDGLALASHCGMTVGSAALAHHACETAFHATQTAAALSMEGFRANLSPLDPRALAVKPLPGQARAAEGLTRRLDGSALWSTGAARRLQDPMSLRNLAQVHGGMCLMLDQARTILKVELNGASDSPVVLAESGEVISCGAYFTAELSHVLEGVNRAAVSVAMAQIARIAKLLDPKLSDLPLFLAAPQSQSNGFAPLMKTAEALAAEIAQAAQPPAIWPSLNAAGIEDCLSTAPIAARALMRISGHLRGLAAIELMVAAQAVDLRDGAAPLGPFLREKHALCRVQSKALTEDRPLSADIDRLSDAVAAGEFGDPGDG